MKNKECGKIALIPAGLHVYRIDGAKGKMCDPGRGRIIGRVGFHGYRHVTPPG